MVNKNYIRGRKFEYKIKALFEKEGYYVFRMAGSRGVADLIAIKKDETKLIQCKYGALPTKRELERMKDFQSSVGDSISIWLAHQKPHSKILMLKKIERDGK